MTENNDPEPSLPINGETFYCKWCKSPLETLFEMSKEAHWDCNDIVKNESITREVSPNIITQIEDNIAGGSTPLTTIKPIKLIRQLNKDIIDVACEKWGLDYQGYYPMHGLGSSTLRPKHLYDSMARLEYDNWICRSSAVRIWFDWINTEIYSEYFVIITGIFALETLDITDIAFKSNGIDMPVHNIQMINILKEKLIWLSNPFSIYPENNLTVRVYSLKDRPQRIGLLGHIIGLRYPLIQE